MIDVRIDRRRLSILLNNRLSGVELDFSLHDGQLTLVRDRARFKVAACGRRWGKTVAGCADAAGQALERGRPFRALWVAPTYDQADEAVYLTLSALQQKGAVSEWIKSERRMTFRGGGCIFFRSAEVPRNLRGRGWDLIVVDEAAYIPDDVWLHVLRPSLMERRGRGVFLSTPNGARGWFHEMFLRGESADDPEISSWRVPSSEGPLIKNDEIKALRRTLPERVFRQEIEVEFLAGEGVVFQNIPVEDYRLPRKPQGAVVIGADIAKYMDFTVLVALDDSGRLVDFWRTQQIDYTAQAEVIASMAGRYRAPVYLDATGVGDAVLDLLRGRGLDVIPVVFTHDSKRQVVQNLIILLERGEVVLPASNDILLRELRAFSARSAIGGVFYSAPPGLHDDCVTALALACWAKRRIDLAPPVFENLTGTFV